MYVFSFRWLTASADRVRALAGFHGTGVGDCCIVLYGSGMGLVWVWYGSGMVIRCDAMVCFCASQRYCSQPVTITLFRKLIESEEANRYVCTKKNKARTARERKQMQNKQTRNNHPPHQGCWREKWSDKLCMVHTHAHMHALTHTHTHTQHTHTHTHTHTHKI